VPRVENSAKTKRVYRREKRFHSSLPRLGCRKDRKVEQLLPSREREEVFVGKNHVLSALPGGRPSLPFI